MATHFPSVVPIIWSLWPLTSSERRHLACVCPPGCSWQPHSLPATRQLGSHKGKQTNKPMRHWSSARKTSYSCKVICIYYWETVVELPKLNNGGKRLILYSWNFFIFFFFFGFWEKKKTKKTPTKYLNEIYRTLALKKISFCRSKARAPVL